MEKEQVRHEVEEVKGWMIWSVEGRIDTFTALDVGNYGEELLDRTDKLALDLSKVQYLSSAGLRMILRIAKKVKALNKTFALCAATGIVKDVLSESGLDMLVNIYDSIENLI